jgi:predicted DNA-binding transcriptional regulator YafY|tara:strand:+ start:304 stop:1302 length:999 start_codon:yes stop_codon:yes gene_type:complete
MSTPTLRQIAMLELIPRSPRKTYTKEIKDKLADRGFEIDERSIQRDLVALERTLPLVCDSRDKPYGWSWAKSSEGIQAPAMDPVEALTLSLAEQYLEPLMPKASYKRIGIFFDRANAVLKEQSPKLINRWRQRVRVLPEMLRFKKPKINNGVEQALYEAAFEGKQIKAQYRKRGESRSNLRHIHPLGIVMKGSINYLICVMDEDKKNPRYLPMHRFLQVEVLNKKVKEPEDFNLDEFTHTNNLSYEYSKDLYTFKAVFDNTAAAHLIETPLNSSQKTKRLQDGRLLISARMTDTLQFEQWLMSFGSDVEILAPNKLRNKFKKLAENLNKTYS